ncbi:MAG: hypothetical protein EAZ62_04705 [Sphingobacteriia bacterium]|nr:MAG: hypothetical protein EAZ62_04705 [Sphingobacteriia bacterium]
MKDRKFPLRVLVLCAVVALALGLSSWGFLVHRTLHQVAVYQLPNEIQPFFWRHMDYLVNNAARPDVRRNSDSTEATKHFIDLEAYGPDAAHKMPLDWNKAQAKYQRDSLLKYGYVPYHIVLMMDQLTGAFRQQKADSILFYAADLGHYIGDANVPLHTTLNYDGQLTNQKGLHSLWESFIPEIEIETYQLNSGHQARYLRNPAKQVWQQIRAAHALVPSMLALETKVSAGFTDAEKYRVQVRRGVETKQYTLAFAKAYAAALKPSINQQLLASANLIADCWYTAWVNAGKPALNLQGWTTEKAAVWEKEKSAYQKNTLIQEGLLLAKKPSENKPTE